MVETPAAASAPDPRRDRGRAKAQWRWQWANSRDGNECDVHRSSRVVQAGVVNIAPSNSPRFRAQSLLPVPRATELSPLKLPCHMSTKHRIFTTSVAKVYPYYVAKAEKKGRKKSEVDAVICSHLYGQHIMFLSGQS